MSTYSVAEAKSGLPALINPAPRPQSSTIWDITQTLRPNLPVWPGDTPYSHRPRWTLGEGGSPVNVAAFETTTHAGTHADAPLHYDPAGQGAGEVSLAAYIGPCRVVDARGAGTVVTQAFLADRLLDPPPRVLLRTYDAFPHDQWQSDFTAVSAETIHWLASLGVVLIGVDAPSLDPQTSRTMNAHHAIRAHDMRILEGLVLDAVPPGDYELIAPPLKLAGLDSSPVRAILRELNV